MSARHFCTAIVIASTLMAGCSSGVAVRKPSFSLDKYIVRPGDTVESVAYRYRLSPEELRSINRLSGGSVLTPGLRLVISEPAVVLADTKKVQQTRPRKVNNTAVVVPAKAKKPETLVVPVSRKFSPKEEIIESVEFEQASVAPVRVEQASVAVSKSGWRWPASGSVARGFQANMINRQGLDIAARSGEDIVAAADGTVVYSGKDLASQGKLVILRHEGDVLSAYSLADKLFVQENEYVKAGDTIAGLASSEDHNAMLHFEIRKNGKPVNPLEYLPKR